MFTYKLYLPDGDEIGQATYPQMIQPGDELHFGGGRRFRVRVVVPFDGDDSAIVGLLEVEAVKAQA